MQPLTVTLIFLFHVMCLVSFHSCFPDIRWSGFLLCAIAMLLVIFPMFTFPKKLPPRHKKKKKMNSDDVPSDDDVMKEKTSSKTETDSSVSASMGFGENVKGKVCFYFRNALDFVCRVIQDCMSVIEGSFDILLYFAIETLLDAHALK